MSRRVLTAITSLLLACAAVRAEASPPTVCDMLGDDARYLVDNFPLDLVDIVTSPAHIADPDSPFRSPRFYLVAAAVGAVWGGSYALDQTMRSHLHNMSPSTADLLQNISTLSIGAGTLASYGDGLYEGDVRIRQDTLTGGEAAVVATVADIGIKAAFGRLRPREDDHSHDAFFRGGRSFVSGEVTPLFSLAAGISESYDNEWYVAAPAYSLALLDGFGRMGHDAHWFSDVVGAGLLGWGSTELFLYLHKRHAEEPSRWRVFPLQPSLPEARAGRGQIASTAGIEIGYVW